MIEEFEVKGLRKYHSERDVISVHDTLGDAKHARSKAQYQGYTKVIIKRRKVND